MHPTRILLVALVLLPLALAPTARPAAPLLPTPTATPTAPGGQPIGTPTPTAAPPPAIRDAAVVWERSDRAVVTWSSSAPLLCIGKYDAAGGWRFLACDGAQVVDDAPAAGDEYLILFAGQILARLPLRSRISLPLIRP